MTIDPIVSQITAIRQNRGWTQQQLADRMRAARAHWCEVENGHRSPNLRLVRGALNAVGADLWVVHPAAPHADVTTLTDAVLHDMLQVLSAEAQRRIPPSQARGER